MLFLQEFLLSLLVLLLRLGLFLGLGNQILLLFERISRRLSFLLIFIFVFSHSLLVFILHFITFFGEVCNDHVGQLIGALSLNAGSCLSIRQGVCTDAG